MNRSWVLLVVLGLGGCESVPLWERGTLANPQMVLTPYPLAAAQRAHVQDSREAGGRAAVAAGGPPCGCY